MPTVSIITATYNSEKYITETIKSVINQSYTDWELLITDDFSTDNTTSIIKKFVENDSRIKLFKLPKNSGPAIARNNSIKNSTGKYLAFLDSDDLWLPHKLLKQIEFINLNPTCALFYSSYNYINSDGEIIAFQGVPEKLTYKDLLKSCSIGCLTAVVNINVTGKIYMPVIKKRQDFALWLKILRTYDYALGLREPLAHYRTGGNSISSNKLKVVKYQWFTYFKIEKLGFIKSIYYMFQWSFRGLKKHYLK
ncbi:MAG: glycosyltransferase family 2 protein [Candidatus Cyclobacteriaceae bacterium M2_1C_046]